MKSPAIYTYHEMVRGCPQGDPQAWREFALRYAPLAWHLLAHYFPSLAPQVDTAVESLFRKTLEGDGAFFSSFRARTERELQAHFRDFVLASGGALGASATTGEAPRVTLETLAEALQGLPAYPKQAFWLWALGYAPEEVAPMLNLKPPTVQETVARGQEALRSKMEAWSKQSLRQSGPALAAEAVAGRGDKCYPRLIWNRLLDGQISWQEREEILRHVAACWFCVDSFSTFQEVVYLARKCGTAGEDTAARIQKAVGIDTATGKKWKLFG